MVDGQQPAALSSGEYVVPADVVSGLGNGNTNAGAQQLEKMVGGVRQAKNGNPNMPPPIDPNQAMPGGGIMGFAQGGQVGGQSNTGIFSLANRAPNMAPLNVARPGAGVGITPYSYASGRYGYNSLPTYSRTPAPTTSDPDAINNSSLMDIYRLLGYSTTEPSGMPENTFLKSGPPGMYWDADTEQFTTEKPWVTVRIGDTEMYGPRDPINAYKRTNSYRWQQQQYQNAMDSGFRP